MTSEVDHQDFDVCVVGGAGHVGLPLAIVFADRGLRTIVYDIDEDALATIRSGKLPFMEKGGEPLLQRVLEKDQLHVSSSVESVRSAHSVIVTIGTPVDEFLNPLQILVRECIDELMPYLKDDALIVLRSTVYPGTTGWLGQYLESLAKPLHLAFCPERVVQGHAIEELQSLPQIVSGATPEAEDRARKLFERISAKIVTLSPIEAEFAKLFNNAYRYIQFATANQFYMIAQTAGVNFHHVLKGMKQDYDRAADFPGPGFAAGPCLFKDTMQLASFSNNQFTLGHASMLINEGLAMYVVDDLSRRFNLPELTVGLLGMAFKADIDDTRSSLSYKLKKLVAFRAGSVLTTDPYVRHDPDLHPLDEVIERSDVLILCVPHSDYRDLKISNKEILDVWGVLQTD